VKAMSKKVYIPYTAMEKPSEKRTFAETQRPLEQKTAEKANAPGNFINFNRDSIVNGIIFSEILGKPRARRGRR
jgi:hypothetical protein